MGPYELLIGGCVLIILSYVFDLLARSIRLPAVLMVLCLGILLKLLAQRFSMALPETDALLQVLGTLGLILIVLESSLDLEITRENLPLMRRAFSAAFFILILTALLIAFIFSQWSDVPFRTGLVNALPFAVISSAIAIPSVINLNKTKKEFVVYESTFSDILGILFFNYVAFHDELNGFSFVNLGAEVLGILLISIACGFALLFFVDKISHHIKFVLLLAVLIMAYAIGKLYHLSTLLLIFVFGLFMNNTGLLLRGRVRSWFSASKLKTELEMLKGVTSESAFLIRTFFFLVFGFSMDVSQLGNASVMIVGGMVIGGVLLIRYVYLRLWIGRRIFPELFVAPRGLITILLYYSIPDPLRLSALGGGTLFFVIVTSTLMMSVALMFTRVKDLPGQVILENITGDNHG